MSSVLSGSSKVNNFRTFMDTSYPNIGFTGGNTLINPETQDMTTVALESKEVSTRNLVTLVANSPEKQQQR